MSLFTTKNGFFISKNGKVVISFDLLLSEEHAMDSVVASHPIDNGDTVSLHMHNQMREGSFEILISNWSVKSTFTDTMAMPLNRVRATYDDLKALHESKALVTIVLGLEIYEDCAITHIGARRDGKTGEAQKFPISFKQIKKVSLATTKQFVAVSKMGSTADKQAVSEYKAGG